MSAKKRAKNNFMLSRGRLAQSGEHSLSTPAIRVEIQAELPLCSWQKKPATSIFQNNLIQTNEKLGKK